MHQDRIYQITATGDGISLDGFLRIPDHPKGVVAFAHGSGSGRFSPRNQYVARVLETGGFATLLLDLLTPDEADDRRKVFDIDLLADRLLLAALLIFLTGLAHSYLGERYLLMRLFRRKQLPAGAPFEELLVPVMRDGR